MIRYKIYQNKHKEGVNAGKWFARSVSDETFDLTRLSEHMSGHNTPYSPGVIRGVLTDMVRCIKELLLDGKSVKIDDLAIFSVGIHSKGAEQAELFSPEKNIVSMRLRARSTGSLSRSNLNLMTQLKQQRIYEKPGEGGQRPTEPSPHQPSDETPDPSGTKPGKEPEKEQTDTPDPIV